MVFTSLKKKNFNVGYLYIYFLTRSHHSTHKQNKSNHNGVLNKQHSNSAFNKVQDSTTLGRPCKG